MKNSTKCAELRTTVKAFRRRTGERCRPVAAFNRITTASLFLRENAPVDIAKMNAAHSAAGTMTATSVVLTALDPAVRIGACGENFVERAAPAFRYVIADSAPARAENSSQCIGDVLDFVIGHPCEQRQREHRLRCHRWLKVPSGSRASQFRPPLARLVTSSPRRTVPKSPKRQVIQPRKHIHLWLSRLHLRCSRKDVIVPPLNWAGCPGRPC